MSCPAEEVLVRFAAGDLQSVARGAVDSHLDTCHDCRRIIAGLSSVSDAATQPTTRPLETGGRLTSGDTLGRYEIVGFLGAGAMGEVYLAMDPSLRRQVAVKVLREPGSDVAALHARLVREAQAMARLAHPNVVSVYEVGDHRGLVFVAMEYVEGQPLRHWLETARPWREVARVFLDAGRGLAAAHARGLIHRDFKPDNVLIDAEGRVRVADFGLAADVREAPLAELALPSGTQNARLTLSGAIVGTPAYMDVGMLEGRGTSPASDQFAFCVAMVEGLTGKRPMDGDTFGALIEARRRGPTLETRRDVPPPVWRVLSRGLSVEPADRFASMDALLSALTTALAPPARPARRAVGVMLGVLLVAAGGYGVSRWVASKRPLRFADLSTANAATELSRQRFKVAMLALATGVGDERGPLVDALRDDPSFSEAALQLTFLAGTEPPGAARDLSAYQVARARRATLSERDQQLLDALGPTFADPPDWREAERRFVSLLSRTPGDAQAWGGLGSIRYLLGADRGALDAFREARRLDPSCSWGLSKDARAIYLDGRRDEAVSMLEGCLATTPGQVDCAHRLATLLNVQGRCESLDSLARDLVRLNPSARRAATWMRLSALHGLRTPDDVLVEYVRGDLGAGLDPTQLAMWTTMATADFAGFLALDLTKGARPAPPTEAAFMRAQAMLEMGARDEAAALVSNTLRKLDVLDRPIDLASDATPYLVALARREGWLTEEEARSQRDRWVAGWRKRLEGDSWAEYGQLVWVMAYSPARVSTPTLSTEALAARPAFGPPRAVEFFSLKSLEDGHPYLEDYGVLLMGAGRAAEADDALARASAVCGPNLLTAPNAGAASVLAQLREERGDAPGACRALALVESEWGRAKPRSVSAERARERFEALSCARLLKELTPSPR